MATQKPLEQMIPEIIEHFNNYADYLDFNYRIYKVLQGQLKHEVECSLQKEIISKPALHRALQRIPSINILKKTTEKLSKVYIERPVRLANNKTDRDIMDNIVRSTHMDSMLSEANAIYNAANSFAIEPYIEGKKHKLRILAPHQFLPYSDNPSNPNEMTVFIKLLGRRVEHVGPVFNDDGTLLKDQESREVDVLALYSDKEFLIIDSLGGTRTDIMSEMGIPSRNNTLGRIPFVYKSKSKLQLIPFPNQEGFDMSVLVPKLLTDLNYAVQFMSHSIIWTKNTELEGQALNPDSVIHLGDTTADGGDPEINTIDPKIDIENNLR